MEVRLMDWIVRLFRSLSVAVRALTGKIRAALLSPAGDPPVQLRALDQRSLAAPVQVWVAGDSRSYRSSNRGRNDRPGARSTRNVSKACAPRLCNHRRQREITMGDSSSNEAGTKKLYRHVWDGLRANSLQY